MLEQVFASEFSIKALIPLGHEGWDIVGIVPKTLGLGLTNSPYGSSLTNASWGGGVGGNVVGVYILLKKEISTTHRVTDNYLEDYINKNFSEFITETESQTLSGLLSGKIHSDIDIDTIFSTNESKSNSVPRCPKCGIPMEKKIATKGDQQGKEYYVCPNYKQCQQFINVAQQAR